jgi:hypothetical protein
MHFDTKIKMYLNVEEECPVDRINPTSTGTTDFMCYPQYLQYVPSPLVSSSLHVLLVIGFGFGLGFKDAGIKQPHTQCQSNSGNRKGDAEPIARSIISQIKATSCNIMKQTTERNEKPKRKITS